MVIPFLWHTWILNHCSLWHFLCLRAFIASMILIWGMPHWIFVHPNIVIWMFPKNRGIPKWTVYNGNPINGWFGGTMIFGNTHIFPCFLTSKRQQKNLLKITPTIQDTIKINVDKSVVHAGAFGTIGNAGGVCITGATVATGGVTPTSSGAISAKGGGAGGEAPSMVPRMSPALVLLCPMTSMGRTWKKPVGKIPTKILGRKQKRWLRCSMGLEYLPTFTIKIHLTVGKIPS